MENQLWVVAVKGDESPELLKEKTRDMCTLTPFPIPKSGLRVGTLDSLMSLSDDLVKMDALSEVTTFKLYKQLLELKESEDPTIGGVSTVNFVTKTWEWDDAKFQPKTPLRELSESVCARLSGMDDELKGKLSEMNALKGNLTQYERKQQGNLMVRSLGEIVKEEHILDSESMTTVFVVVPNASNKEFLGCYERMAKFVVPKSVKKIVADIDLTLYSVVILKNSLEQFKDSARDKRYSVRDFTFSPGKLEEEREQRVKEGTECARLAGLLTNWLQINFAEAYSMMLHLKAIRLFVESVLRYGLSKTAAGGIGPSFQAYIMQPKRGKLESLRKTLDSLYGGAGGFGAADQDADMVVPGVGTGDFYPYVYLTIELEAPAL